MSGPRIAAWVVPITLTAVFLVDRPVVWAVFWAAHAIRLGVEAKLTWERAGLFWSTVMTAYGSAFGALLAAAALAGYTITHLVYPWMIVFWSGALVCPVLVFVSWLAHHEELQAWEETHPKPTLRDMLLFRHIPDLRSARQS